MSVARENIRSGIRLGSVLGSLRPTTLLQSVCARFSLLTILFFFGTLIYTKLFIASLSPYWFNPKITTDDALQQLYPFHVISYPGVFDGDLITEVMLGYLAPLHYWISYGITYLTRDPIMMGHWVMLIQLALATVFVFLAVRHAAGTIPALFSVAWLFHTRNVIQRLTAGLPRGWSAPILSGTLYFMIRGNHRGVLITLLAGCLLNPPSTIIAAVTYGLFLTYGVLRRNTRSAYLRPFLTLLILSPLYLGVTMFIVARPDHIGNVVTLETAEKMPEFDREGGRFNFLPFRPALEEITMVGMQAFVSRWYNPGPFLRENITWIALGILLFLLLIGQRKKIITVPHELLCFLVAIFCVYFASRAFAFRLYVPDRHLQFPMAFFFILAFPIGLWRAFYRQSAFGESGAYADSSFKRCWISASLLLLLAAFIYVGSLDGLKGKANFNYPIDKRGDIFRWISRHTAQDALIAGNPTHIDGVQLFGIRKGYATTETAHPFYPNYMHEMERRLAITWRAYYATEFSEIVNLLQPEGVDYLVFKRADFYPETLKTASYFKPGAGL